MKPRSSIETVTDMFLSILFQIARDEHPDVEDEVDLLPYICDLLRSSNSCYKRSLEAGKSDSDAIYDVLVMLRRSYPNLTSHHRRWFWRGQRNSTE